MKIGILGGSFNPIHKMHITLAKAVKEEFSLDEIYLMPTYQNPFKLGKKMASAQERLAMVSLCAKRASYLKVCELEALLPDTSFTVDTMRTLKASHPKDEFFFILGSDTAEKLPLWRSFDELSLLTNFIVARREDDAMGKIEKIKDDILKAFPQAKIEILKNFHANSVSSTKIRSMLLYGEDVSQYLYRDVLCYIEENNVYYTLAKVREHLENILSAKRFLHSVNVAQSARELAGLYGEDVHKAYFAGLIHDCAKELDEKSAKELMAKWDYSFSPIEEKNPSLRHQTLGCLYAVDVFGVEDPDVLNAVSYHTSAREGMSTLEKIIFLSDLISADRNYPGVDVVREKAREDLDLAMVYSLTETQKLIQVKGQILDERALQALRYFMKKANTDPRGGR